MIKVAFYMTLALSGIAILAVAFLWVIDHWSEIQPVLIMKGTW